MNFMEEIKIGDLIRLQSGTSRHWGLRTGVVVLLEKLPREDTLEYDWKVLTETGRTIELGRQIEASSELVSAS
tara:strand:+ start:1076 stop:1294 length:219 start_codon:yes stop_codon:yes gene_type:complete